jgi:hypothetical protein
MTIEPLGFFGRLWLGFILPWRLLFDGVLAARTQNLLSDDGGPFEDEPPEAPVEAETEAIPAAEALQLLGLLQREGRLLDFLMEPITDVSDADIGAAARVVHAGCRKVVTERFDVVPIRTEDEGATLTLEPGYDAQRNRVTGNVTGEAPYSGRLAHHGWESRSATLPTLLDTHDPRVLAPAEVELP